ncbi:MAG: CDP-diacylglycerol--glycerol-3-phosphate 3-phosphatidyltransferase [Gemmatimonadales bacterium]|nr:MAG: CDP-diacylglycerol--glycerol-3-phosphate 3-phosphatidyltransferase [Gemmatimonadales bacterium]
MAGSRINVPNLITVARIAACPVVFVLALGQSAGVFLAAFIVFVVAAVSDLWDGYLARKHGWITDMGKLLDPLADKLLMAATMVPFYLVSHRPEPIWEIPWWGPMPLWVLLVIFGRELFVTLFRSWAARRGAVISAGPSGKYKAFTQNIFSGALLLWYSFVLHAGRAGWEGSGIWEFWGPLHGGVVGLSLLVALVLTVYSMGVYLVQNRYLFSPGAEAKGAGDS